ncbi:MAG: TrgA family protein [Rhodobacterales bacterium]
MLTSAKLIAGMLLACTAVYTYYLFISLSSNAPTGLGYYPASTLLGFLVGWRSIGFDPGFGGIGSIVAGLRGVVVLVFVSAVFWGGWLVTLKLIGFYIKDFPSILSVWVSSAINFLIVLTDPGIVVTLLIGGCISGIGSGLANRYWT